MKDLNKKYNLMFFYADVLTNCYPLDKPKYPDKANKPIEEFAKFYFLDPIFKGMSLSDKLNQAIIDHACAFYVKQKKIHGVQVPLHKVDYEEDNFKKMNFLTNSNIKEAINMLNSTGKLPEQYK